MNKTDLVQLNRKVPYCFQHWNNYLLVVYNFDSNSVLAEPMSNHTKLYILHAYKVIHTRPTAAGLRPKLQHLDNMASLILKEYMSSEGINYQLVPPCIHCHNASICVIWTFKNYFIDGLCSTDKNCHLNL